ncbi:MAG: D-alanine--D-alanine ligase [Myxococcota bacterium]|nr:D-alanine--D-alanine ligase [Myxococcota bacterium]
MTRPSRLSVAVVQGGPSTEAEVSRASARGVATALEHAGHQAVRLEINAFLAESLRSGGYDVVFPVAHGAVGEDGSLQGLLEVLDLPYVGSGLLASALAMHKRVARIVFAHAGLAIPEGMTFSRGGAAAARAAAERARRSLGQRLVVKPSSQGSAIGVTRLEQDAPTSDVARAIEAAWALDEFALVEDLVAGREVTCGVLDTGSLLPLPPTEIISPSDAFYTYQARYIPGRSVHICPADLSAGMTRLVQEVASAAHRALGCRDLSRVDFVVGEDAVTLLEVNTLPGMTATSLYPEAAAAAGFSMGQLCDALVRHAHTRGATNRLPAVPLPR